MLYLRYEKESVRYPGVMSVFGSLIGPAVDLSPFENGAKFEEYFKRGKSPQFVHCASLGHIVESAFATEFGISFKVDDAGAILETKRRLLKHYTALLKRTNGDIYAATRIAGRRLQFTVINPFKLEDDRRRDFDSKRMYPHSLAYP